MVKGEAVARHRDDGHFDALAAQPLADVAASFPATGSGRSARCRRRGRLAGASCQSPACLCSRGDALAMGSHLLEQGGSCQRADGHDVVVDDQHPERPARLRVNSTDGPTPSPSSIIRANDDRGSLPPTFDATSGPGRCAGALHIERVASPSPFKEGASQWSACQPLPMTATFVRSMPKRRGRRCGRGEWRRQSTTWRDRRPTRWSVEPVFDRRRLDSPLTAPLLSVAEIGLAVRYAQGVPVKAIAADSGRPTAATRKLLACVKRKMLIQNDSQLVVLFGGANRDDIVPVPAGLTATISGFGPSERRDLHYRWPAARLPTTVSNTVRALVLEIVDGASREALAQSRGRSPRTVANQIASIFRKLRVGSRVELLVALLALGKQPAVRRLDTHRPAAE